MHNGAPEKRKGRPTATPTQHLNASAAQFNDNTNQLAATSLVRMRGAEPVTDSLAIAAEFGRRHDNVLQTLSSLISDGTIGVLDFQETSYSDQWNRKQRALELNERGALIAMPFIGGRKSRMGHGRLVDAFMRLRVQPAEMAPQPSHLVPQTFADALRLAATLADQCAGLESKVERQAVHVAALARLSAANGSMNITCSAKSLKVQPKALFAWLARAQWIYRRGAGAWTAYQVAIMRGLLEHKTATIQRDDGSDKVVAQVLITPKGLSVLARKLANDATRSEAS